MGTRVIVLMITGLIYSFTSLSCQVIQDTRARIENINFFILNDMMHITYDLAYALPSQKYNVGVRIFTGTGTELKPTRMRGDLGDNVTAGDWTNALIPGFMTRKETFKSTPHSHRTVAWKISEDMDSLIDNVYIQIEAIHINPRIFPPTDKVRAMLLSTIYPGWGSQRTTLHSVHLLKGVAGYLCLYGSLRSGNLADKSYSDYLLTFDGPDRYNLYNQTEKHDRSSRALMLAAGAIWLSDYINILLAENNSKKTGFRSELTYLKSGTANGHYSPGISFSYHF